MNLAYFYASFLELPSLVANAVIPLEYDLNAVVFDSNPENAISKPGFYRFGLKPFSRLLRPAVGIGQYFPCNEIPVVHPDFVVELFEDGEWKQCSLLEAMLHCSALCMNAAPAIAEVLASIKVGGE